MAETYYIRLPFYLLNKTILNRWVYVVFDETHISTAEISATDKSAMDYVTFSVTKEPGNYMLKVKPVVEPEADYDLTTVYLDDVWVSKDNVNFYSVLLNYSKNSDLINKSPNDDNTDWVYGFNPLKGACLYGDVEFSVEIALPAYSDFNQTYSETSIAPMLDRIASLEAQPSPDTDLIRKLRKAHELFQARGYN